MPHEALEPRVPRRPSAVADQLVVVRGPRRGRRLSLFCFQVEIADALAIDGIEQVAVMGSSQWGKTTIGLLVAAWGILEVPTTILIVLPNEDPAARAFSRERLDPLIRASPELQRRVSSRRSVAGTNSLLSKTFMGGSLSLTGAHSPAGLASRDIEILIGDELDRWPPRVGDEGPPLLVARRRTEAFGARRKILLISTPDLLDGPTHTEYKLGDQRQYFARCPYCDGSYVLKWEHVRYPEGRPAEAAFVCPGPDCGVVWSEADRLAAVEAGEWRATAEASEPSRRSYHIWAGYSEFTRLAQLATEYEEARAKLEAGDPDPMRAFRQTVLGLPVDVGGVDEYPEVERLRFGLLRRREPPKVWAPPRDAWSTAGVDVQADRLEVLQIAWGAGDECWLVDYRQLWGDPYDRSDAGPWAALETWRLAAGKRLARMHVDSGFAGDEVDWYVLPRQRLGVAMVKGVASGPVVRAFTPREKGPRGRKSRLWTVGTDAAKALWWRRFGIEKGPGSIHAPEAWFDEAVAASLVSEVRQVIRSPKTNRARIAWTVVHERNEVLDMAVYALHGWRVANPQRRRVRATPGASTRRPSPGR